MLLAYANAEPTKAKTGTNDIFGDLYEATFDPNRVTAELVRAAYVCFERIQDRKRTALAYQRHISRSSFEEAWIIEGAFHVLFAVGELLRRKGLDLTDPEASLSVIDDAFEVVAQFVQLHPKTSAYRLFRGPLGNIQRANIEPLSPDAGATNGSPPAKLTSISLMAAVKSPRIRPKLERFATIASNRPYHTKPEKRERRHCQLHVGNDNPPAVLLVKPPYAGVSR